jgi:BON domain
LRENPRLRSLKLRSELVCQLKPLRDKDIAADLKTRLRAAQLAEEAFDSAAIDRIAAYSGGNHQLINAISNRALQVSDGSPVTHITAEELRASRGALISPKSDDHHQKCLSKILRTLRNVRNLRLADTDTTEVVGQTFLNYTFDDPRAASRNWQTLRLFLILLVLLAGGAAGLQTEAGKAQLSSWIGKENGGVSLPSVAQPPLTAKQDKPAVPEPRREFTSPPISDSASNSPSLPDGEKSAEVSSAILTEKATGKRAASERKPAPRKTAVLASKNRQAPLADTPDAPRKLLQAKIHKAIENRAIRGVTVSVIKNITYLDGQVATESQRNAAEQAARSVAGVERVRNRIVVPVS